MSFYGNIFNKFQNAFNKVIFKTSEGSLISNSDITAKTVDDTLIFKNDPTLKWVVNNTANGSVTIQEIAPQVNPKGFTFNYVGDSEKGDYKIYELTRKDTAGNSNASIKIPKIKILDSVSLDNVDGKVVLKLQFNVDNDENASAEEIIQLDFDDSSTIDLLVQDKISGTDKSGTIIANVKNLSITEDHLASNAVTTAKIKSGNVTETKIASDAITAAKIKSGAVTEDKIADSAVTNTKIADSAVTNTKIANSAVTTAKIADKNITTAKIADKAITAEKLDSLQNRCVLYKSDDPVQFTFEEDKSTNEYYTKFMNGLFHSGYLVYEGDWETDSEEIKNGQKERTKGLGPVPGNILVIETLINENDSDNSEKRYQRQALTLSPGAHDNPYDTSPKWRALDKVYDASNIYLDSDLVITADIGVQKLDGASFKTLLTSGKSVKQVMNMIFAKEEAPKVAANPSVTTKIGTNSSTADKAISVEAGTTIKPYWNASFSKGAYSYGPDTGLTPKSWEVIGKLGGTAVSEHIGSAASGSMPNITLAAGQSYVINAKATYGDAPLAYTNLGEEYKAGNALFDETEGATSMQITGGSKNDDSQAITAWQQGYYIGTLESDIKITSDILRNVGPGAGLLNNRKVKNGNYAAQTGLAFSATDNKKMAKFVIAYPASVDTNDDGSYNDAKGLVSFFNNSAFEEYKPNFTRSIVTVAGADNNINSDYAIPYTVWTWTPAAAFTGVINFLIDLK